MEITLEKIRTIQCDTGEARLLIQHAILASQSALESELLQAIGYAVPWEISWDLEEGASKGGNNGDKSNWATYSSSCMTKNTC